jgi:TRAP-type C4-dicarboxylate transport system permease small subunit
MEGFHRALLRAARVFGVLLVIALILIIAGNIVFRELLHVALVWADETAITLFVWIAFIGAGISFAENARIRFTFVVDMFPPAARAWVEVLVSYVGLVLFAGFVVTGAYVAYVHRDTTFTTMQVTVLWQWAAVPLGTLLALEGWIRHGTWTPRQARHIDPTKLAGT